MKRTLIFAFTFLVLAASAYGIIEPPLFQAKAFADDTYIIRFYDTTDQVQPEALNSQPYDFGFKERNAKYEIRYILFSQVGTTEDYKTAVLMWALTVVANITGADPSTIRGTAFNDSDVRKEFDADYGLTFLGTNHIEIDAVPQSP